MVTIEEFLDRENRMLTAAILYQVRTPLVFTTLHRASRKIGKNFNYLTLRNLYGEIFGSFHSNPPDHQKSNGLEPRFGTSAIGIPGLTILVDSGPTCPPSML